MLITIPKEMDPQERRIPMVPNVVDKLVKLGASVAIETGMGLSCGYNDGDYTKVGATVENNRQQLLAKADIVLRFHPPHIEEIAFLKAGAIHISYLNPFNDTQLLEAFAKQNVTAISLEMMPRTTKAQKMDVLSSQNSLAGYVAIILAAERLPKIFPMLTTAAGTIPPAKVFIIGAGVAGLQAIATAKRLGARVEAYDTRPAVEEQILSLGARFVKVDLGETGQTKDGYAKELTPEQIEKQRATMAKHCINADVVVTTAQVFGRKAPLLITEDTIAQMRPGSVVIDLAVETGGNVAGSLLDQEIIRQGVRILGLRHLPSRVAVDASQMYANNLFNLISDFWDKSQGFQLKMEDEILRGCVIVHDHKILFQPRA